MRKLVLRDTELLCKDSTVALRLIEHVDKVGVLKDVLDLTRRE